MNIELTRAAEGFPRRAFTAEDIRRMVEAGVLAENEPIELIEGDVVMMAAKGIVHERIKHELVRKLVRAVPDDVLVGVETTLQLSEDILLEPDITVLSRSVYEASSHGFARPRPDDIFLLIEIAASTMAYDRDLKARLYSRFGIREFWVIDANERTTWIHTGPSGESWSTITERKADETLSTPVLPGFSVRLHDLG